MPNRLADERSPYLLQHRDNPVDWYPWGDEAFEASRGGDLPILLSIGYAACHWCHVMERESFEDAEIAALMNEHFVNVKVDREEHPAVDSVYMTAVQRMTGHGGWPLTAFLLPSGEPFYGGTYFPPTPRHGLPSFRQLLLAIAHAWRERREDLVQNAAQVTEEVRKSHGAQPSTASFPGRQRLGELARSVAGHFDPELGGTSGAPKFPQPIILDFLLRRPNAPGSEPAVHATLRGMAAGGLHDQVGGGFHRYSVDAEWTVPHFEKMLYDNAQLALLYLHGWQASGEDAYLEVASRTMEHLLRDMRTPEGLFASSLDADTQGKEGLYYIWTEEEVRDALPESLAGFAIEWYGITPGGNFEGRNIPRFDPDRWPPPPEVREQLRGVNERLREAREARVRPGRDDKAVLAWNAMAVRALAELGRTARSDLLEAAFSVGEALYEHFQADGRWMRVHAGGQAYIPAHLEDCAACVDAFLALFEASGAARWMERARETGDYMLREFWVEKDGILYDAPETGEAPAIVRARDVFDGATPSGTSSAARALARLSRVLHEPRYAEIAERIVVSVGDLLERAPSAVCRILATADEMQAAPQELVLAEGSDPAHWCRMREIVGARYLPNVLVAHLRRGSRSEIPEVPLLAGRVPAGESSSAYLCERFSCRAPIEDPEELAAALRSWGTPE